MATSKIKIDETKLLQALEWTEACFPLEIRKEAALVCADYVRANSNPLFDAYLEKLDFGTGGMRALVGNGPACMNVWTVAKITFALCLYLQKANVNKNKKPALVIAYDSRKTSYEFAQTATGTIASMGFKVHLFQECAPTPILSYTVRKLKAQAGIIITASHNPPQYNGYKIYDSNGSQFVGVAQEKLEECILSIKNWSQIPFASPKTLIYKKNVTRIGYQIKKSYIKELGTSGFVTSAKNPKKPPLKIVYTPLHGVGATWMEPLLREYGFSIDLVKEQAKPDGNFPTVNYPNPEAESSRKLAKKLAESLQADLFLITDPDADRLGAGIRNDNGSYHYLNGNQLGIIMCAFLCENYAPKQKTRLKSQKAMIIKSIVTSDLQSNIAKRHGMDVIEVLTGFKYIADHLRILEEKKDLSRYVFGSEESHGYLPVHFVRDKDALASALLLCEILAECGNLNAYLDQIYLRYGLYLEDLKFLTLKGSSGKKKIASAMERLRKSKISDWKIGDRHVVSIIDYKHQLKNAKPNPKFFKSLPPSDVLQFLLEPDGKLTIRPSGTEPKIKLYASLSYTGKISTREELEQAKYKLKNELHSVSGQFIARTDIRE